MVPYKISDIWVQYGTLQSKTLISVLLHSFISSLEKNQEEMIALYFISLHFTFIIALQTIHTKMLTLSNHSPKPSPIALDYIQLD